MAGTRPAVTIAHEFHKAHVGGLVDSRACGVENLTRPVRHGLPCRAVVIVAVAEVVLLRGSGGVGPMRTGADALDDQVGGRPPRLRGPAQGRTMRPGADIAPFWVWQPLQSPGVCAAAMSRSRPM